jgi:hypothetical protein
MSSIICVIKNQVSSDLNGQAIILSLESGIYYSLDQGVGSRIWSLIQQPRSIEEILNTLLSEYDVSAEDCSRDLLALLQQLKEANLIEVKDLIDPVNV